ncbi:oligosaccharide flippase family protein [Sinomicrobium weinanense]|uniref:Oligosaccharide flippase family protein n=1 Tax=Sinomicrobium weinanense TaxID=2842200 RepID=A0A926Q508_9FLAO|nr:oligosaccharide flippase family protein [Sinomicrobium weinanense]MBC9797455.1 oligosaccharide flippase family protein [Sinomicrobium weinanense]MBU3125473.1 oligosaccharide flippase family protein [Sinomicrobium weinanense]
MQKEIKKVKELGVKYKNIISNFSYLSLLQFFNLLVPLITYPYLIRVLGAELYGVVIFAQTVTSYCSIFISFGFDISGAQGVAVHRADKRLISEIVSSILIIKIFLWLIALAGLLTFLYFADIEHEIIYLYSFTICFNELLFPQWYFQGIEKLRYVTLINLCTRSLFVLLIFVFVREQEDFLYVPLLNGVGAFIGGLWGEYILFFGERIKFELPSFSKLKMYFKESSTLFASNIIISVKDRFNVFFIGIFLGMHDVAVYDLGVKIMTLIMKPIEIINASIYPQISRTKDMNFVKKIIKYTFLGCFILIVVLNVFLNPIISLLADNLEGATTPIRILLICPLILAVSLPLARNCLTIFKKYNLLLLGMTLTTAFYLLLIGICYYLDMISSVTAFAIIAVVVYIFEFLYRYYMCKTRSYL